MLVRQATEDDADEVAAVLAAAFRDYEWTRWTVDADDHVRRIVELQRLAFLELTLRYGEAWIAAELDGRIVSAAMWMRPDRPVPDEVWASLAARTAELEGDRHDASHAAEAAVAPHRPVERHYFLGAVGTLPSHQRRGFGGAVLAPVLSRDETCGLETCGADNVAFYEALGFRVTAEVQTPDGGPTVYLMTKDRFGTISPDV